MPLHITALYAALIAIWAVILSNHVSLSRGKFKIPFGDGGNPEMMLIMRRHANLMENAPMALLVMALAEASGLPAMWAHLFGVVLLVARLVHPFGLSISNPTSPLRIVGAVGTHAVTVAASLYILWTAIPA
jgi:uncharacterized protein